MSLNRTSAGMTVGFGRAFNALIELGFIQEVANSLRERSTQA
jgi:hypothetical protein